MKRKSKIFLSLVSLCFSVAVLCFGVYSALSVSYTLSGSVSYELSDVFVDIETKLYLSTSSSLTNSTTLESKISEFETTLPNAASETIVHSTYSDGYSSNTSDALGKEEDSHTSKSLPINYGAYQADTSAYAYYIVVKIQNLADNTINAVLNLGDTSNLNSIIDVNHNSTNIQGRETIYFVIGMALDDATISVNNQTFSYGITITTGELKKPTLYQQTHSAPVEDASGFMIAPLNSTPVDWTSQSIPQTTTSQIIDDSAYVAMTQYTLDFSNATPKDWLNISFEVSSDANFIYAFVLSGTEYTEGDFFTILGQVGSEDAVSDILFWRLCIDENNPEGVTSFTVNIENEKLSQVTGFTIMIARMSSPFTNITISNLNVLKYSEQFVMSEVGEIPVDKDMTINLNAEDGITIDWYGQVMKLYNFEIKNWYSDYSFLYTSRDTSYGNILAVGIVGNYSSFEELSSSVTDDEDLALKGFEEHCEHYYNSYYNLQQYMDDGILKFCIGIVFINEDTALPPITIGLRTSAISVRLNEDGGSYTITDFHDPDARAIEIPSTYNGLPITEVHISDWSTSWDSFNIPEGVKKLYIRIQFGNFDFITLPSTLEEIYIDSPVSNGDFYIRQININITSIKDWTETGGKYDKEGWRSLQVYDYRDKSINLYLNGKLLSGEISLDGITQIRDYAFGRVNAITSVIIPSTVTSIGSGAFSGCTDLSEIYIDGQDVASMLTGTSSAGGLLNNITTGEKVYIKSGLSVPTYMTENFTKQSDTVVVNDVTYDVYVRK